MNLMRWVTLWLPPRMPPGEELGETSLQRKCLVDLDLPFPRNYVLFQQNPWRDPGGSKTENSDGTHEVIGHPEFLIWEDDDWCLGYQNDCVTSLCLFETADCDHLYPSTFHRKYQAVQDLYCFLLGRVSGFPDKNITILILPDTYDLWPPNPNSSKVFVSLIYLVDSSKVEMNVWRVVAASGVFGSFNLHKRYPTKSGCLPPCSPNSMGFQHWMDEKNPMIKMVKLVNSACYFCWDFLHAFPPKIPRGDL